MKFRLGPMHSEIWPWTKTEGRRYVKSWFIFRLCQLFPGRTFWGHTYGRQLPDGVTMHSAPNRYPLREFASKEQTE